MRWIEATIDTPEAEIDARCEALAELGCGGFIIENENDFKNFISDNRQYWGVVDRELEEKYRGVSRIKFYLSDDEDGRAVLAAVRAAVPQEVCTAFVQDSDWENNWRQYYKPIEIGDRLVVVPEWQDAPEDGRVPLRLDPGLIFGTGTTLPQSCALRRWKSTAALVCACWISAAAAEYWPSARCCWEARSAWAATSTQRRRKWPCTMPR
jgi:ribosomal protein L11 methyltransferase